MVKGRRKSSCVSAAGRKPRGCPRLLRSSLERRKLRLCAGACCGVFMCARKQFVGTGRAKFLVVGYLSVRRNQMKFGEEGV